MTKLDFSWQWRCCTWHDLKTCFYFYTEKVNQNKFVNFTPNLTERPAELNIFMFDRHTATCIYNFIELAYRSFFTDAYFPLFATPAF